MRLITVIEAPLALVEDLLARLYKPRELARNGWVRLIVRSFRGWRESA